jgi:hypothetical protein
MATKYLKIVYVLMYEVDVFREKSKLEICSTLEDAIMVVAIGMTRHRFIYTTIPLTTNKSFSQVLFDYLESN